MTQSSRVVVLAVAVVGYLVLSVGTARAAVTWDSVVNKVKAAKSYEVLYRYKGPRGQYDFDYAWTPDQIRDKILRSKTNPDRRGTVIVWDKSWSPTKVRARIGGGIIVRNITHKDVRNTPFYQSLFQMIFNQVAQCGQPTVTQQGDLTVFHFQCANGPYTIWANSKSEIVRTQRQDDLQTETRVFLSHKWNCHPKVGF